MRELNPEKVEELERDLQEAFRTNGLRCQISSREVLQDSLYPTVEWTVNESLWAVWTDGEWTLTHTWEGKQFLWGDLKQIVKDCKEYLNEYRKEYTKHFMSN